MDQEFGEARKAAAAAAHLEVVFVVRLAAFVVAVAATAEPLDLHDQTVAPVAT